MPLTRRQRATRGGFGALGADVLSHVLEFLHVEDVCGGRISHQYAPPECKCKAVSKVMRAAGRLAMTRGRFSALQYFEDEETELVTRAERGGVEVAVAECRAAPLRAALSKPKIWRMR